MTLLGVKRKWATNHPKKGGQCMSETFFFIRKGSVSEADATDKELMTMQRIWQWLVSFSLDVDVCHGHSCTYKQEFIHTHTHTHKQVLTHTHHWYTCLNTHTCVCRYRYVYGCIIDFPVPPRMHCCYSAKRLVSLFAVIRILIKLMTQIKVFFVSSQPHSCYH